MVGVGTVRQMASITVHRPHCISTTYS